MTKSGGRTEKNISVKTKSLPQDSKRHRKHSFEFRWVLLGFAVIGALAIGLSINGLRFNEGTT